MNRLALTLVLLGFGMMVLHLASMGMILFTEVPYWMAVAVKLPIYGMVIAFAVVGYRWVRAYQPLR